MLHCDVVFFATVYYNFNVCAGWLANDTFLFLFWHKKMRRIFCKCHTGSESFKSIWNFNYRRYLVCNWKKSIWKMCDLNEYTISQTNRWNAAPCFYSQVSHLTFLTSNTFWFIFLQFHAQFLWCSKSKQWKPFDYQFSSIVFEHSFDNLKSLFIRAANCIILIIIDLIKFTIHRHASKVSNRNAHNLHRAMKVLMNSALEAKIFNTIQNR